MIVRTDSRTGLIPAVLAVGSNLGRLIDHSEKAWNSATFSGARHTIVLEFVGKAQCAAAERFAVRLPTHEFMLAGHKVCDAKITRSHFGSDPQPRFEIEAELLLVTRS